MSRRAGKNNGGRRPGAGRPRGSVNPLKRLATEIIGAMSEAEKTGNRSGLERMWASMLARAQGEAYTHKLKNGVEIVSPLDPDPVAARLVAEYYHGKPPQQLDHGITDTFEDFLKRALAGEFNDPA